MNYGIFGLFRSTLRTRMAMMDKWLPDKPDNFFFKEQVTDHRSPVLKTMGIHPAFTNSEFNFSSVRIS